jgi:ubiquinone/menaquinone biosynthesis C-methylase UbiE
MLAVARSIPTTGASIEWIAGSALSLPFPDSSFDLVLCQLGLQFFPDRPLALRQMRRVLGPSGRVALSVYSAIERTPAAYAFATVGLSITVSDQMHQVSSAPSIFLPRRTRSEP